jgi:saccharopine dehydrogenase-like NADP-dependent oxidoreductase
MVLIYISVEGIKQGELIEESYVKKILPMKIAGLLWSAIQVSTASSVCAIVDLVLHQQALYQGLISQEQFQLSSFLSNRFGRYYDME